VQSLKIALTIAVALLLQMILPKHLGFVQYIDLPLLITVYFGLQRAPMLGMAVGVLSGLGGDAIAGGILGVRGFTKTLLGYLVAMVGIRFSLENPLARLGVVAVASAANTVIFAGLTLMLEQPLPYTSGWGEFGKAIGKSVLLDSACSLVIFLLLDKVFPEQPAARRMAIRKRFYE
jgi:rod shape-determining protein MreD